MKDYIVELIRIEENEKQGTFGVLRINKEVALTGKSSIFIYSTEVASIPDIEALKGGMIETLNESDDFKKGDIIWFDIDKEMACEK
jgi:hypothetical protein